MENVSSLKKQLDCISRDEAIADENTKLKSELGDKEFLLQEFSARSLRMTRLISSLKKQVKVLTARLEVSKVLPEFSATPESVLGYADESCVTIEEAVDFLKDKCIYIVGGERHLALDKKLQEKGLNNVRQFKVNMRTIGSCDIGVCLASYCSHSSFYRFQTLLPDECPLVSYNGSNVESLLMTIYDSVVGVK